MRARKRAATRTALLTYQWTIAVCQETAQSGRISPGESNRQDVDRAGRAEPDHMRLTGLGVGHQTILGTIVLREVPHDLADIGDTGGSQRMALAEQAARDVYRIVAAEAGMLAATRVDEGAGLADAAQAEVLVVHQLGGGEAIMQFSQRDVLGADA